VSGRGLMAEFREPQALLAAARAAREAGYRHAEAYSPMPVEGLAEALGARPTRIPLLTLVAGVVGGGVGYGLQWWSAVVDFRYPIGGRPLHAWPMFVPVTFEMVVLFAAFAAFLGALVGSGLPRLSHPVFDVPDFDLASSDRFFLCLRADDPAFEPAAARALLQAQDPVRCMEAPR
jgi:hypothetical protein